jgi:signal transduction histidine kinase
VTQEDLEATLESALHALVSSRCARAYRHDVRNGLQGVYGGVDALIRCARPNTSTVLPLEKTIEFVREAVTRHETSLDRMVEHLAPGEDAATDVQVSKLLAELAKFLSSDAARHAVRLREDLRDHIVVHARASRLRLIFLGLITDSIDAVSGGEVRLASYSQSGRATIDIADSRPGELAQDPWQLDLAARPLIKGILLNVTRTIVLAHGGEIVCESAREGGRIVRMTFPLASAS